MFDARRVVTAFACLAEEFGLYPQGDLRRMLSRGVCFWIRTDWGTSREINGQKAPVVTWMQTSGEAVATERRGAGSGADVTE